jgi:hypothetical protein
MATRAASIAALVFVLSGCGGAEATDEAATDTDPTDGAGTDGGPGGDGSGADGDGTASEGDDADTGDGPGSTDPDATAGDDTGDSGDPPGPPSTGCAPLEPPRGPTITIGPADDFAATIAGAPTGTTILLSDGTYDLSGASYITFDTPGVTLRSESGDAEAVVLDGGYQIGSLLNVRADDVTIAEITLQRPMWHPIHVTGGADGTNTENTTIYGVRIFDPGQQAIKINASAEGQYADGGTVACSTIVMTAEGRANVTDCYTGGIDAHGAWGWSVHDNWIEGFWCEAGLSEHAVHFWSGSRDTIVERNTIVDCARGVGFGLGESGNGTSRAYDDDPCPGASFVGHYDGIIRNNAIVGSDPALFGSQSGFDSGVALEQACGAVVVHNTVVATEPPFVSMEYRFGNTSATIANNLVTHDIVQRDGGQAELQGNLQGVDTSGFVDIAGNDLHLSSDSAAIDAGTALRPGLADEDIDGDPRDGSPDVGADEIAG